jgi:hypothetical protein
MRRAIAQVRATCDTTDVAQAAAADKVQAVYAHHLTQCEAFAYVLEHAPALLLPSDAHVMRPPAGETVGTLLGDGFAADVAAAVEAAAVEAAACARARATAGTLVGEGFAADLAAAVEAAACARAASTSNPTEPVSQGGARAWLPSLAYEMALLALLASTSDEEVSVEVVDGSRRSRPPYLSQPDWWRTAGCPFGAGAGGACWLKLRDPRASKVRKKRKQNE